MRIRIDHIGFSAKGVRIAVVFLSFGFWISLLKVTVGSDEPLGVSFLKSRGLFSEAKMYWISAGALIGYIVLFNCLITLALTFLKPLGKSRAVVPPGEIVYDKDSKITELEERRSLSSKATSWRFDSINMVKQNGKRGMSLPFEPHSIIFYDIKYAVDMPKEIKALGITEDRLELLKGVSGAFRPGVLTALMGVSGAGKTTLMDVLAGRKTGGYISGNITISGYPKKQETFARIAGYCEQTDIHSPHLSLYESLQFSSWLRLPSEVDSETRKLFIEEVMEGMID